MLFRSLRVRVNVDGAAATARLGSRWPRRQGDGRMVGLGRHADLLKTCPVYEEIYASQFKKGDAQK